MLGQGKPPGVPGNQGSSVQFVPNGQNTHAFCLLINDMDCFILALFLKLKSIYCLIQQL